MPKGLLPLASSLLIGLVAFLAVGGVTLGLLAYTKSLQDIRIDQHLNVDARYHDCEELNAIRDGLRLQVRQGEANTPLLLKLIPALDTPAVLKLAKEQDQEQLRAYAPQNCHEYAQLALPVSER